MEDKKLTCLQPEEIVVRYYQALYGGDLKCVKNLMTEESYFMTLESSGVRLSFRDPAFKSLLKMIGDDTESLQKVEEKLIDELISRNKSPLITIKQIKPNGSNRKTILYEEDGKAKMLYFSKNDNRWLIDYYAGRPVT